MNNPFIPIDFANVVIVDGRIYNSAYKIFKKLNINVIPTVPCKEVQEPISYHPDIVMHPINHNTLIVAPNVFEYYYENLSKLGIKIIQGEKKLNKKYPDDIAYNVGRIHNFAIHNFKYTDEKLKYYLKRENLELIHVKQGYTKCSMAIVDNKAIITSDYPIYEKLKDLGIDVLFISPGYIRLDGYDYGFIGGTCGNLSKKHMIFSGKISQHPDKEKILNFLKKYNKKVIWLDNEEIIDVGTIISLNCHLSNSL